MAQLAAAGITLITVFSWVHWSAAQTALVTAESGAVIGFISALVAHFYPSTPKVGGAIVARGMVFSRLHHKE